MEFEGNKEIPVLLLLHCGYQHIVLHILPLQHLCIHPRDHPSLYHQAPPHDLVDNLACEPSNMSQEHQEYWIVRASLMHWNAVEDVMH